MRRELAFANDKAEGEMLGSHAVAAAALCALMAASSASQAQPREFPKAVQNPGGVVVNPVELLRQPGVGPLLIGGKEARTEDWRASFHSRSAIETCTATLIGPDVLLLAAHCVGNGQDVTIALDGKPPAPGTNTVSGPCTHSDRYKNGLDDPSADYALCKLRSPILSLIHI